MVNITFKTESGEQTIVANIGETLLMAAQRSGIKLYGGCHGAGVCGTCHVYVEAKLIDRLDEASADEEDLLSSLANMKSNSRLACQIIVTKEMDGTVITISTS
jgi:2Fe-2S ferredoxin